MISTYGEYVVAGVPKNGEVVKILSGLLSDTCWPSNLVKIKKNLFARHI